MSAERIDKIEKIVKHVKNMPMLPSVMSKLLEIVDDPHSSAPQLARFLNNDPALTAKILKLANSAFYGFPQRIGTINLAIVVLGFQSVKYLGLSASGVEIFAKGDYQNYFDPTRFWLHSIASAAGCKIIADKGNFKAPGEIFVSGLLHDIGILVLCNHLTDEYRKVLKDANQDRMSLHDAELRVLGFSHADVGGYLLEKWRLPAHQSSAIYDYPNPWVSNKLPKIAMLVNFSDILARRMGYSILENDVPPEIHPKVISYLNLKLSESGKVDWDYYQQLLTAEMSRAKGFLAVLRDDV